MNPVYHFGISQHTPEWYAMRAGKWTASNAATIMGGLDTKGLDDLVRTVAWERVFGATDEPRYQSAAMTRGNEMEAEAREWTAFNTDSVITECGFVQHAEHYSAGWSPDGLHSNTRGIEIKCLLHKAYLDVMLKREVPSEYRWQCRWAMWVGRLSGLDFVVYHPKPGGLVIPVEPDTSLDSQMAERVETLEKRVVALVEKINNSRSVA